MLCLTLFAPVAWPVAGSVAWADRAQSPTAQPPAGTPANQPPANQPATPRPGATRPPTARPPTSPAAQPPATQPPATQPGTARPPGTPVAQLAPIDVGAIPAACKPLVKQASSPSVSAAYTARISLASCMAARATAGLSLCDCADSIVAIDAAAAPAIALLDDVIASAEPAIQAIAEDTEGQIYAGFAVRLRATLPAVGPEASAAEVTLHDLRAQALEAQMAPWHEAAMAAFEHVVELAKSHPEFSRNAATATAVRDAQQRITAEVATR
ncbi:MAG TPA: hypothetical protein VFT22_25745 [Kofleriaceae bacterium]|nr:hypothetical protein [Kofleriaceae bacterium]